MGVPLIGPPEPLPPEVPTITGVEVTLPENLPTFKIDVEDVKCPDIPTDIPKQMLDAYYRDTYCFLRELHVGKWISQFVASQLVFVVSVALSISKVLVLLIPVVTVPVATIVVSLLDELRKVLDTQAGNLGVAVLNEILGTEFNPQVISPGSTVADHIARAQAVGKLLHDQLLSEFSGKGEITPDSGVVAAHRFSGFNINFGTATGMIGLFGELASFGLIGEFREIGEQVARNLGLGRLHRMALRPLIDVMIAIPYHWWLNQRFHPTLFTVAEAINPFAQTLLPHETIFHDLELAGYTPKKIEQLIQMHQKKLTDTDVEILVRWGSWARERGISYIKTLGFPDEIAETLFNVIELRRADARVRDLVSVLEGRVAEGHLSIPEFEAVLDKLPLAETEKSVISTVASYKQRSAHAQLTLGEMQTAFENALVDLVEFEDYLRARGFDPNAQVILTQLTLLKTAQLADARKAKEARQAKSAARAAALAARIPRGTKPPPITSP